MPLAVPAQGKVHTPAFIVVSVIGQGCEGQAALLRMLIIAVAGKGALHLIILQELHPRPILQAPAIPISRLACQSPQPGAAAAFQEPAACSWKAKNPAACTLHHKSADSPAKPRSLH